MLFQTTKELSFLNIPRQQDPEYQFENYIKGQQYLEVHGTEAKRISASNYSSVTSSFFRSANEKSFQLLVHE